MAQSPDNEIIFRNQIVGQGDVSLEEGEMEIEDGVEEGHGKGERPTNQEPREKRRYPRMDLPVKPEEFNGNGDWEEYISHFELCAELGNWMKKEKVLALAVRLRGPARSFYINLSTEERGDYVSLVEQLGQRFGSTRRQTRWLSRLEARKRQSEKSITALGDDLRQMTKRAYPTLVAIAQEALALNQFYKCITLGMKCRCIDRNCAIVAQAVDVVERYEDISLEMGAIRSDLLKDVNGNSLPTYSIAVMQIQLEGATYQIPVLVCDMFPAAIVGQDFLLKYVSKIDYRKFSTGRKVVIFWIGGEAEMTIFPLTSLMQLPDIRARAPNLKTGIVLFWELHDIQQEQLRDPDIYPLLKAKDIEKRPPWEEVAHGSSQLKTLWSQWDRLQLVGGLLYRNWEGKGDD
ncbi:hypothetical protein LOTGIDRAFT_152181 [Lottia gigantea]|uniref:Uncharacterized protein n=1 Tax=Lottia gigantea TaxID=225164 RepID=V4CS71_LOTGI|nr:hypothetical protein LOTGIDRAFT_152181 [Lottia gigantea]ESP05340.1 hypothetical protein LOTGIDRAFT_152181 [Lottia gigantea]